MTALQPLQAHHHSSKTGNVIEIPVLGKTRIAPPGALAGHGPGRRARRPTTVQYEHEDDRVQTDAVGDDGRLGGTDADRQGRVPRPQ